MDQGLIDHSSNDLTEQVLKAFYKVYNTLGYGFLEKVYVNALLLELTKMSIRAVSQHPIHVHYDGSLVGEYYADLLINDCIIVEVKATKSLALENEAQLLNYLKATNIEVGLLLNFGPKPEVRRKLFDNSKKQSF